MSEQAERKAHRKKDCHSTGVQDMYFCVPVHVHAFHKIGVLLAALTRGRYIVCHTPYCTLLPHLQRGLTIVVMCLS